MEDIRTDFYFILANANMNSLLIEIGFQQQKIIVIIFIGITQNGYIIMKICWQQWAGYA